MAFRYISLVFLIKIVTFPRFFSNPKWSKMIVRIVKMTFLPEKVGEFLLFFEQYKEQIRNFPGCIYLQVLQDKNNPHVIFSYSHWKGTDDLDNYRNSELFKKIWPRTKELFMSGPEAWTTEILHDLL